VQDDDLEKFKERFNVKKDEHKDLIENMKPNGTLFMYLSYSNKFKKITDYILETHQLTYPEICFLIKNWRRRREKNKERLRKGINSRIENILDQHITKLNKKDISKIINCLAHKGNWTFIEKLHELKHRAYDHDHFIKQYIKYNSIDLLFTYTYKMTDDLFYEYLKSPYATLEYIDNLKKHHKSLETKNINILFKYGNEATHNFILKNYKIKKEALNYAIHSKNYILVKKLLTQHKFKLTKQHVIKIFDLNRFKLKKKKARYVNFPTKRDMRSIFRFVNNNQKLEGINDILALFNKKLLQRYLQRIYPKILFCRRFEIVEYLSKEFSDSININKKTLYFIIDEYIKKDDVNALKNLFKYDIIEPIYFHKKDYCSYAINRSKFKIVDYCINELDIHPKKIGPINCKFTIRDYIKDNKIFKIIDYIKEHNYPLNDNLVMGICRHGSIKVFRHLIDSIKDIKMKRKYLPNAILYNKFGIANLYIKRKLNHQKKNLLTSIIKIECQNHCYGHNRLSFKNIDFTIKKGGKISGKQLTEVPKMLLRAGYYEYLYYLCSKFNFTFDQQTITKSIENIIFNYLERKKDIDYLIKLLEYFEEKNIYSVKDTTININNLIRKIFKYDDWFNDKIVSDNAIKIVKYLLDQKPDYQINPSIITKIFSEKYIKVLEQYNVLPTEQIFTQMLRLNDYSNDAWHKSAEKYIQTKYNYKITTKQLNHLVVEGDLFGENLVIREGGNEHYSRYLRKYLWFDVEITPYTHELCLQYHNELEKKLLKRYNKVTQKVKDYIDKEMPKFKDKVEVVEYQPREDEIPSNLNHDINNYDNDNDAFIERVLNEE